ncbi:MAG TPA: N-acetylmuramoyl-L-alanine amidase [Roseiarcus sp.]|nr:N-acetylmuramoyl-L-alanine amidase [Roseiarcus sp.]
MARMRWLAAFAALAFIAAPLQRGFATDAGRPVAVGVRVSQDSGAAKLVFDLSRPVDASAFALTSPDRIVVDLPEVNFQLDPSVGRLGALGAASVVKSFRFGLLAAGKSRIVVDLAREACPTEVSTKPIVEGAPAARLTIELKPCDPLTFAALVRSAAVSAPGAAPAVAPSVIVLDPGHGGADSGARGLGGVQEKTLVYEFCAELKRQLDATRRYSVVMTRDGDQYVDLDDRIEIARAANASLFVSVHADILSEAADVSGSTVYTAADRASDAEAARIAARENAAGGGPRGGKRLDDPDVTDILFDLKRRETRAYAHIFSRGLVESLRGAAKLNRNPERSAGFVVLRAPEFPSVLIELGYLSNAQDVQALTSAEWRAKTAAAVVNAIDAFFSGSGKPVPAGDAGVALTGGQAGPPPDR